MEHEREYYWVVLCKNQFHHFLQNHFVGHVILLGETDSVSPPPAIGAGFKARCDECGKEYSYRSKDLLRFETEPPESFLPHPQFGQF